LDNVTEEKKTKEETVKEKKATEAPQTQRVAQNTVFIGGKPPMSPGARNERL